MRCVWGISWGLTSGILANFGYAKTYFVVATSVWAAKKQGGVTCWSNFHPEIFHPLVFLVDQNQKVCPSRWTWARRKSCYSQKLRSAKLRDLCPSCRWIHENQETSRVEPKNTATLLKHTIEMSKVICRFSKSPPNCWRFLCFCLKMVTFRLID